MAIGGIQQINKILEMVDFNATLDRIGNRQLESVVKTCHVMICGNFAFSLHFQAQEHVFPLIQACAEAWRPFCVIAERLDILARIDFLQKNLVNTD